MIDQIICGDCLEQLEKLPSNSVDCCVTSPPYFGLRDYGCDGQIGMEETPEAYVSKLVEVFREVRRVLKKGGTLWLNLGDSYASSGTMAGVSCKSTLNGGKGVGLNEKIKQPLGRAPTPTNCKPKDLIGIPWMVAFALRADGWYLRSDIIWNKPNCMPESVSDRPTKCHEYVFLLSKKQKYYYDSIAIQEESITKDPRKPYTSQGAKELDGRDVWHSGEKRENGDFTKRNKRTVWTIPTKPFAAAHFATFPEALVEPCILAGTSEKGYCPTCGTPWIRQVKKTEIKRDRPNATTESHLQNNNGRRGCPNDYGGSEVETIGWLPSCQCSCDPRPGIVLDPFFGAGTVGLVAAKLGRRWVGIELNPKYCAIARKRIAAVPARLDRWAEGTP